MDSRNLARTKVTKPTHPALTEFWNSRLCNLLHQQLKFCWCINKTCSSHLCTFHCWSSKASRTPPFRTQRPDLLTAKEAVLLFPGFVRFNFLQICAFAITTTTTTVPGFLHVLSDLPSWHMSAVLWHFQSVWLLLSNPCVSLDASVLTPVRTGAQNTCTKHLCAGSWTIPILPSLPLQKINLD